GGIHREPSEEPAPRGEERWVERHHREARARADDLLAIDDDELALIEDAEGTREVRREGAYERRVHGARTVEANVALRAPSLRERRIEHGDGERVVGCRRSREER